MPFMPHSVPGTTSDTALERWFVDHLVCPREHNAMGLSNAHLTCAAGHSYPIVLGIPVMLLDDVSETHAVMSASLRQGTRWADGAAAGNIDELFLETLGISPEERQGIARLAASGHSSIDPVVNYVVAATNGMMYRQMVGNLRAYPIPEMPVCAAAGEPLLDIGCGWGRWCVAAAKKGYSPVGLDPSLGAVLAARRVARQLGVEARFVVGDARWLPFRKDSFDTVFSYSVLQHFSDEDARKTILDISRVLHCGGSAVVQLPNAFGLRCLYHQFRRGFRAPAGFEVRYWSPGHMRRTFDAIIGQTVLSPDCFFGIGLQASDIHMMPPMKRALIAASELGKRLNASIGLLTLAAESLWVTARKA
jgi:2-polyprenyl-3-methyl-5-hydroxy-6-metoxy-1,4-benzoquinol methylase/uncharacterized protein YbaR (Trm112 family)